MPNVRKATLLAALVLLFVCRFSGGVSAAGDPTVVQTDKGSVHGTLAGNLRVFLGIPFAAIILQQLGLPWVFYLTGLLGIVWLGLFLAVYRSVDSGRTAHERVNSPLPSPLCGSAARLELLGQRRGVRHELD